ncbi:dienelactone hydrolase family protein [Candidatus Nitrotoga sp. AM1P]|uniref:dienelactone hydrolase family protein n=1 Tax=Candidatus Nitrotoga sp. AM1P TaxID=2559597 RepID=UPI0010B59662|nr:dienelactone hydrolase family protein [Candidatus Nitrotoga sp. AM1P]BBJ24662.1 dienelactone hydrolase [Candidatus Nitrotoga sp. AM1P]
MNKFLLFAGLMFVTSASYAAVQGKEVTYNANGINLKGYIAYDDAIKGKRPGILVVHEWWGHNEYARKRARMLAERGYTALAVDMYGDGQQAHHPDDAGKLASNLAKNTELAKARFESAYNLISKEMTVDSNRIAAIGYCFGGSVVLHMARIGEPLKAVMSFHGDLGTEHPAETGKVKARIASFTGEDDPMIPATQVAAFKQEMEKAGVTYKAMTYPSAKHSFTNPDADKYGQEFKLPLAYNAAADKASWDEGMAFLADALYVGDTTKKN